MSSDSTRKKPVTKSRRGRPAVFYWRRYVVDAFAWCAAIAFGAVIRYDGMYAAISWPHVARLMLIAVVLQLILGYILMVYHGRHPWGSFEGFLDVLSTTLLVGIGMWMWTVFAPDQALVPRSLVLIATPLAIIFMAGTRYLVRLARQQTQKPPPGGDANTGLRRRLRGGPPDAPAHNRHQFGTGPGRNP